MNKPNSIKIGETKEINVVYRLKMLFSHLHIYPPTHLPIYAPTHLPTCPPTHLPTYPSNPPAHLPTYPRSLLSPILASKLSISPPLSRIRYKMLGIYYNEKEVMNSQVRVIIMLKQTLFFHNAIYKEFFCSFSFCDFMIKTSMNNFFYKLIVSVFKRIFCC